jgi:ribosome-binding protein aMBF1 (putative translation factor)
MGGWLRLFGALNRGGFCCIRDALGMRTWRIAVKKKYIQNSVPQVNPDLFLSEEALVAMAMRELKGRRPPCDAESEILPYRSIAQNPNTRLSRELEARGWTVRDLARALDISSSEAVAFISGKARINVTVASQLAKIFATSEEFWTS